MPDSTSLVINAIDANNKKVSNNITYVNPNISNNTAVELAQRISALSSDSYQSTTRVDKTNVDTTKPARTISDVRIAGAEATLEGGIYKGTAKPSSFTGTPGSISTNANSTSITIGTFATVGAFEAPAIYYINNFRLNIRGNSCQSYISTSATPVVGDVIKFTLVIAEDEIYAELRVTYEITIVADE